MRLNRAFYLQAICIPEEIPCDRVMEVARRPEWRADNEVNGP